MTVKPPLARNIMMRRKALGYKSASAFAEALGLPYPTLRDIEAGISNGRRENLEKIAKKLGCPLADLYRDGPDMSSVDALIARIIEVLPSASRADLESILTLLAPDEKSKSAQRKA